MTFDRVCAFSLSFSSVCVCVWVLVRLSAIKRHFIELCGDTNTFAQRSIIPMRWFLAWLPQSPNTWKWKWKKRRRRTERVNNIKYWIISIHNVLTHSIQNTPTDWMGLNVCHSMCAHLAFMSGRLSGQLFARERARASWNAPVHSDHTSHSNRIKICGVIIAVPFWEEQKDMCVREEESARSSREWRHDTKYSKA